MASALSPAAQMYALNIAVIVKGACGSGKASLVRSAARELGFHLVEVSRILITILTFKADCFSIIGDTDAVTEGTLQAIADKAVSCAPCVVLLKHIEALARKSESMASGQGATHAISPPITDNHQSLPSLLGCAMPFRKLIRACNRLAGQ